MFHLNAFSRGWKANHSLLRPQAALRANGVEGVKARAGYLASENEWGKCAEAHAWLEVDGRVLDIVADGLALCEAARRAGVDYADPAAMEDKFGADALAVGEYNAAGQKPLTILNMTVHVGGEGQTAPRPKLTLKTPPESVPGAPEAIDLVERFAEVLSGGAEGHMERMPAEVREVYERIASIRVETVEDEQTRAQRLKTLAGSGSR